MDNRIILLAAICSAAANVKADDFHANSPYTNIADTSRVYDIDEIIVAAPPKDLARLRRQPLSSTSLSATMLNAYSSSDLSNVSNMVPSLVVPEYGTRYTSTVYVRGIGSRVNSPAIGMYVDDIPLVSKCAFNTHLYDLQRVDILRGPQGTLYGQNAEGGLIRVYTKSPLGHDGTDIKFGIGRFLSRKFELGHYGNVQDLGSYSISAFYNGRNGFQRNTNTRQRADDSNEAGMRMKFVRQQTDRLTIALTADYQWVRQNGFAYGEYDIHDGLADNPSTNFANSYRRHVLVTGVNAKYHGRHADVNSTTSYQFLCDRMLMDQDYTPTDYLTLGQRQLMNAITEEIAVKSHATGRWQRVTGAFLSYQWLKTNAPVGFGDGITQPIGTSIASSIEKGIMDSMVKKMVATGLPQSKAEAIAKATIDKAGGVSMDVSMDVPGTFHTPQANAAIFHESSLQLSRRTKATLGLRYDISHVSAYYDTRATMAMDANIMGTRATNTLVSHLDNNVDATFSQLLPKIGISTELGNIEATDHIGNLYATISKGYRAGGYNLQMFSDILQAELMANRAKAMNGSYEIPHNEDDYANVNNTISYKPETSWNYEIGAHLNLFGSALLLDMSAYLMQIKNQQLSVMAGKYGFGRMMVNAGRSRSFGVESTMRGSALNNSLSWNLSYGYTNATFRSYTDGSASYRGKRVPYIPCHTLSANADYSILANGNAIRCITIGLGVTAQGDTYWDEANTYSQPFYALLNAHALVRLKRYSINIWAKNICDTRYCTFAMDSSATGEKKYFGQRGTPFTFGADFSISL